MKHIIKDNFLNTIDFDKIKSTMLGIQFPWFVQDGPSYLKKYNIQPTVPFFWSHMFFRPNKGITSEFFNILTPILKKLDIQFLIRIKANLYSSSSKIEKHKSHADFSFKHKGALFSLNTCNGFTMLMNNTKVKSIENRVLLFDPSKPHYSSTCTDVKIRCNININYF